MAPTKRKPRKKTAAPTGPDGGPVQVETIPLPVFGPNDPLNHFDQADQEEPEPSGDDDPGD